jgi:gliding motility-associated-like protein
MLCAGTYTVTVIDASNCVETVTLAIPELDPYSISIGQTPADCGACNGSAQALVSGAGGSYNYTWTDTSGMQLSTSAIADSLCSGIYFLSITDQTGCDTSLTITISDADGELIIGGSQSPDCATSCNGLAFIQYTCSDPPCLIEWFDGLGNTLGVTNDTLSPVCAGSYVVSVTNASACVTLETVIVDPALGIQLTAAVTGISCNGLCDGSASVSISSGTGPFSYQWTPAPGFGQGTPAPSDMCAGTYDLLITDSLGCDTTISVTVPDVAPFNVFVTVDGNDCAGECSAAITLNPSGSNPPYFYNWSVIPPNGQGGNQAIGLCAGNYTVTIFDSNNCDTTITVTVSDPAPISTSVLTTPSSCGSCDGTLALTLTGGTGSVSVEWFDQMGIPVGSGSVLTNQCAGIYTAVITDSLGCDTSVTSAISDIDGELIVTASQPTSCSGTCNGSASISYVCSNPPCNVEWFDIGGTPIGQTSDTATGLCAGGYFVVLTNGLGCLTIDTVDIGAPAIGSIQFSTTPISCFGDCDGTATVSVTGGAGPFTYFWNPAPAIGQGTPTAGGLCVGSYTVTVSDANMCDTTLSILLIGPDELTATSLISNPTCAGQCDGSVFLVPSGGTPPYNYTWSPVPANGQGNNEGLGLCADTAFVDVEDANGCILNLAIPLTEPTPIIISLSVSDPIDCFGDCIGTADAVISGGIPPYQLTWLDSQGNTVGQDTLSLSALCAGSYTFLVIDSAGCASDTVFTIDQSDPFSVSLFSTNEGCISPCDAYAVVDVSGATGSSYNYSWSPSPPFGAGTDSIAGLCPGPWQVTITDSIGCDTTLFFTVGTAIPINVLSVQTDVSCFGSCDGTIALDVTGGGGSYDYQWTPAPPFGAGTDSISGLCPGSWQVLVSDSSGCDTTLLFMITEPDSISVQLDQVTSPTCASVNDGLISITVLGGSSPFVYQWSGPNGFGSAQEDISNLFPGTYTLMLLDDADCEFMYSITLDPVIEVIAIAGSDTVVCANGDQFYLDGSGSIGATTYAWTDLNGDPLGSDDSLLVSAGSAGTIGYVLTVSDGGQCFDVDTVLVTALQLPFVDAGPDQSVFGSDQILTLGGSPTTNTGNSVVWSPDTALSDPFAFNPQYPATQSGWFLVSVVDSSGCTALDSVFIEVLPEISVPSGFSPNGDGINDIWEIDIDLLFPDLVVEIYNRWGNLLYRSEGYTIPWDGNYEGDPVPVGTYYYVIDLKSDEYPEPLTGPLTILR